MHERIRADIEARILSGSLTPGDRLPTESELCATYGCARMTVSKALSALATAGLIERRKKAGSFVARPRVHAMVLDVPDLQSEVEGRGGHYAFRLLSRETRPARANEPAVFVGNGEVLVLTGVHLADGRPLAFEERMVNLAAVPAMRDADLRHAAPGTWLLDHVPWTEAETRISAAIADAPLAKILELAPGAPCLVIERRTWRGADGITTVQQHFDALAYDLNARFSPRGR
jgi:GntR family transcriptional regulator, histidine utilization repressor